MAVELAPPGVDVEQVFATTSTTVVTPTLPPCIVGVCRQIVEVTAEDGDINPDAQITQYGLFNAVAPSAPTYKYSGLDETQMSLSYNGGPAALITFSDASSAGLTSTAVVRQINEGLDTAGVTGARAYVQGTTFYVRTVGTGSGSSFSFVDPTDTEVQTAFGLGVSRQFVGTSRFDGHWVDFSKQCLPNPRSNIDQLEIENDSMKAYLGLGDGSLREFSKKTSYLRGGNTNTPAILTGTVDVGGITFPSTDFGTKSFYIYSDDLLDRVTVTFANPGSAAAVLTTINDALTAAGSQVEATSNLSGHIVLTSGTTGGDSYISVLNGTFLVPAIGFTNSQREDGSSQVSAPDDGNGDQLTPYVDILSANFSLSAMPAVLFGVGVPSAALPAALAGKSLFISDGGPIQEVVFPSGMTSTSDIKTAIESVVGVPAGGRLDVSFTTEGANVVVRISNQVVNGFESEVEVWGAGTVAVTTDAAVILGFITLGATYPVVTRGRSYTVLPGDDLYTNGALLGVIAKVMPGGVVNRLKLDRQVSVSDATSASYYIIAKGLDKVGGITNGRPTPEFEYNSLTGVVHLKHRVIIDVTTGLPASARSPIYFSYRAVRKDVSPAALNPGLLTFSDTTTLTSALSPISAENPLALGLYMALINAPGSEVSGIGVDEATTGAPYGTVEAFTRAAEFLESRDVYAVTPLTHDTSVAQLFKAHADTMSDASNRGERICLFNFSRPTLAADRLITSGTEAATIGSSFDTAIPGLPGLLASAGLPYSGAIPVSTGLYVEIDGKHWLIATVTGSIVTPTEDDFAPDENLDGFYEDPAAAIPDVIGATFVVKVRGKALVTSTGAPDKTAIAETYQKLGLSYGDRRFWSLVPDKCGITLGGVEQLLEGFYLCAGYAGAVGGQKPQVSFTEFPLTGYSSVPGSNDFFSGKQMNVIAAGGHTIMVQEVSGAPVVARMALTTDTTTIEKRTDSITKCVDMTAKFMRRALRKYIGRNNINQGLLDSLGHVCSGLLEYLVNNGVLIEASIDSIIQDASAPDTVLIIVTLEVPYPCNRIKLTLVV